MLSQGVLIAVAVLVLVLLVVARVALNNQIRQAKARADVQERAWRERQAREPDGDRDGG